MALAEAGSPASVARSRWLWAGVAALLVIAAGAQLLIYKNHQLDDAFITFRYAKNLAHGHGFAWNVGGPPVEGYTSFAWVVVNSLPIRLGIHPLAFSQALGTLAFGAVVVLPLTPLDTVVRTRPGRWCAAALIALSPVMAFYAVSGMEETFFVALVLAAALLYLDSFGVAGRRDRRQVWAALCFAGAALTRPEGVGFFGLTLMFEALLVGRAGDRRGRVVPRLVVPAVTFLVVWLPYYLWRLNHYGWPFPNTYYAKRVSGLAALRPGWHYLVAGAGHYLAVPVVAGGLCWLAARGSRTDRRREEVAGTDPRAGTAVGYLCFVLAAYAGYVVVMGGDYTEAFPSSRLLMPVIPFAALLAGAGVDRLALPRWRDLVGAGTVAVFVVLSIGQARQLERLSTPALRAQGIGPALLGYRPDPFAVPPIARWLNARFGSGRTVATPLTGVTAYYTNDRILDTLGLNDEHIAHHGHPAQAHVKTDPAYVLSQRPDIFVVYLDKRAVTGAITLRQAGVVRANDTRMADLRLLEASPDYVFAPDAPDFAVFVRRDLTTR